MVAPERGPARALKTHEPEEAHGQGSQRASEILVGTIEEVARRLDVSRAHVARLHATGRLPQPIRLGRSTRWNLAELARWVDAGCPNRDRWEAIDKRGRASR